MRILFIFLILIANQTCALEFNEQTRSLLLGQYLDVFEDVRGDARIEDVTSALEGSFRRYDKSVLNAGYSHSAFWLRLDLDYRPTGSPDHLGWLLELAYSPLDQVDLYLPDGQGGFRLAQRTGDSLPFSSRQLKQDSYLFSLDLPPRQVQRIYLRLQSQGSLQAPLTLWSVRSFIEEHPAHVYMLGIIYGVLLVMLIYNLFIFLSVRDPSYLYYILYIGSFGLYQISVNGPGVQYLWPDNTWWSNAVTPLVVGSAALFGCQFARSFLRTSEHSPWSDRALLILMALGGLVMVLALTSSHGVALRLATTLALTFTVVVFCAGVTAWLRGMRVARYFIIAWSAFLLGGVINSLMVLGYLPNVFFTMYSSQLGSALEVGLLSLALADRINTMKEERARILQDTSIKLEALNQELANSNRLKDEFLATITHELRTPMSGVIGSLELMQTLPLEDELAQYQRTAAYSARDMMRLVNDILAMTELQAGKLYAQCETFSLRGLVDSLRVQYAPRAEEKGLVFEVMLDHRLPDILEGDAGKLSQALGYLLDNAVKFTTRGSIRIRIRVDGEKGLNGHMNLRFEVIDTGIGFSAPSDGLIYRGFFQLDGTITREYGGLGIGLTLSQQLVELLDGKLYHCSQPGQGSTFSIELPFILPAQVQAAPACRVGTQPVRRPEQCCVLVVEDNAINQLVTRGMLLKLGYRVRTADNGVEALEQLRRDPVDAVLLDCQMPIMDGFATCRALRALEGCTDLPVLAATAHSHSDDRERCLAAGMSDYLAKPVKFEQLQALLHDWVLCVPRTNAALAD